MRQINSFLVWFVIVENGFGSTIPNTTKDVPGEICLTKTCIQLSNQLFDNMNTAADPCDDFYEFTCGNFILNQEIPEDKGEVNGFEIVKNIFEKQGKTILEKEQSESDWEIFQHFRSHYKACMNESAIEEISLPLIKSKLESLGGWPILKGQDWSEEDFHLTDYLVSSNQEGLNTFALFEISVETDEKGNDSHVIKLDQAWFGISREFLVQGLQEQTVLAYRKYMGEIGQHFGVKPENLDEFDKVLELEMDLARIGLSRESRRDPNILYNEVMAQDIPSTIIPSWPELLDKIFENENITGEEKVVIQDLDYIRNLESVLDKHSKRTLVNYLGWRIVRRVDSYLDSFVLEKELELDAVLRGKTSQTLRWKRCVKDVGFNNYDPTSFQVGVGSMFVQEFFSPKAKEIVEDMLTRIRITFSELIVNSNWMDDVTISKAQAKLDRMGQMIGYPDELLNKELVTNLYRGLQVSEDQYLQNHLNRIKVYDQLREERLRKPASDYEWVVLSTSALVNAFYEWEINSMLFNAAFLQDIFFQIDAPMFKNYGAVGVAIGHEITHGFDDQGRQFDQDGQLINWWTNTTDEAFDDKKECFIDLFDSFEIEEVEMNVNGRLTLGENIADFGGIRSSHLTYERFLSDGLETKVLPGHPYTPLQLFWIFFGQSWCSVAREEEIRNNLLNDDHSPSRFRINGPLSNYEGFAKDFGCKPGDRMVKEKPCRIW